MNELTRRNFLTYAKEMGLLGSVAALSGCKFSIGEVDSLDIAAPAGEKDTRPRLGLLLANRLSFEGRLIVDLCVAAAKLWQVNLSILDYADDQGQLSAAAGALLAGGAEAIAVQNPSDANISSCLGLCEEKEAFLALFDRSVAESSPAFEACVHSPAFAAVVHKNLELALRPLIDQLVAEGRKKIGLIVWSAESPELIELQEELRALFAELKAEGTELFEALYAKRSAKGSSEAVELLLEAHNDLDALIVCGGGSECVAGAFGQLQNMGADKRIAFASCGLFEEIEDYFAQGKIFSVTAANFVSALYALAFGLRTLEVGERSLLGELAPELSLPNFYLNDETSWQQYKAHVIDQMPLTDDHIKALTSQNLDELKKAAESFNYTESDVDNAS